MGQGFCLPTTRQTLTKSPYTLCNQGSVPYNWTTLYKHERNVVKSLVPRWLIWSFDDRWPKFRQSQKSPNCHNLTAASNRHETTLSSIHILALQFIKHPSHNLTFLKKRGLKVQTGNREPHRPWLRPGTYVILLSLSSFMVCHLTTVDLLKIRHSMPESTSECICTGWQTFQVFWLDVSCTV